MRHLLPALVLTAVLLPSAAMAGEDDLRRENAGLRDRVQRLEEQLAEVLRRLDAAEARAPASDLDAETERLLGALARDHGAALERGLKPVRSTVEIEVYGFVKVDAAWDSARSSTGNFARWVESEEDARGDDAGSFTARDTRLGLKLRGPDAAGAKTSAQVEIDFYGEGAENKPQPMLRHAFLTLDWPDLGLSLLAGQTWDVIAPLFPVTLNATVLWWSGNIGYRRPQVRLTKRFELSDSATLEGALAAARDIGRSSAFGALDSGADAGTPGVQGRLALTLPLVGGRPATIGVSGHFAREQYDTAKDGAHADIDSWSTNLDLVLPLSDWLGLKAEAHRGRDLDQYVGGIGQGVNLATLRGIAASGAWFAAVVGPFSGFTVTLGAARERLSPGDLAEGARERNRTAFVQVVFAASAHSSIGLELSSLRTVYAEKEAGDGVRLQVSFIFRF